MNYEAPEYLRNYMRQVVDAGREQRGRKAGGGAWGPAVGEGFGEEVAPEAMMA